MCFKKSWKAKNNTTVLWDEFRNPETSESCGCASLVGQMDLYFRFPNYSFLNRNRQKTRSKWSKFPPCGGLWASLAGARVLRVKSTSRKCPSARVLRVRESCGTWLYLKNAVYRLRSYSTEFCKLEALGNRLLSNFGTLWFLSVNLI